MRLHLLAALDAAVLPWTPHTFESAVQIEDPAEPRPWRTYQWAYRDFADGMSPLLELRIRASMERHLSAGGFQQVDPPELTVAFFLERGREADRVADDHAFARDRWSTPDRTGPAGALVVDICDARTFRTLWRGVGSRRIVLASASQADIEDAVVSALGGFTEELEAPRGRAAGGTLRYSLS